MVLKSSYQKTLETYIKIQISKSYLWFHIPIQNLQQVMAFHLPANDQLLLPHHNNLGPKLRCQFQNKADNLITDMKN